MSMTLRTVALGSLFSLVLAAGCSSDDEPAAGAGGSAGAAGGGAGGSGGACPTADERFPAGDANGHAEPFGARAASQARAGRYRSAADIVQPAHGRQQIAVGDFVLANARVAVSIEDGGLSDGYARFGGEILAVDPVGDDGRPLGRSKYIETLMALSIEMVNPESVSVLNDGADGNAAVVRVSGVLEPIPFLNGALGGLFPRRYGLPAAVDYVLEPDSERLLIRVGIINPSPAPVRFQEGTVSDAMHGFFHYSQNHLFTSSRGFDRARGAVPFAGFVNDVGSFAWRPAGGGLLEPAIEISGFQYFVGDGFEVPACSTLWVDHAEVIVGGSEADGLLEALRRVDGAPPWRAISGTVVDGDGAPQGGAFVQVLAEDGTWLSRTRTAADGSYTVHAPPDQAVSLRAQVPHWPLPDPVAVPVGQGSADLALPALGTVHVVATELGTSTRLPVRVQVIPETAVPDPPAEYGPESAGRGRLAIDYAVTGEATLRVPAGRHRVIVSRGAEWELHDVTVDVTAGATAEVAAALEHSVDTTGVMCADFHIHSAMSADSNDPILDKVKSAISDGLDLPISSEHEWVLDFQPVIEALGLQAWAFGIPSAELTTFTWGHFGVVPLTPRPGQLNNGAVEWIGRLPPAIFEEVQALPEDPVLVINHPKNAGFGGYFSAARFDRADGTGNPDLWSTDFDAIEVFNGSTGGDFEGNRSGSVRDWFALLELGFTFWGVGSSDSHHIRSSPVGYPRTCLAVGTDDPEALTANHVRDTLALGRATVAGGLYMTVEGPGGIAPGGTVSGTPATADFLVTVQAPSWLDATELEIIVNGVTQATEPLLPLGSGPGKRWVNSVTVTLDPTRPRNWVLFHARGDGDLSPVHPGEGRFAVSNPVFFTQ